MMRLRPPRSRRRGLARLHDGPRLFAVAAIVWAAVAVPGCIAMLIFGG
jgi:hypothetical protein